METHAVINNSIARQFCERRYLMFAHVSFYFFPTHLFQGPSTDILETFPHDVALVEKGALKMREWKMQEWEIQELKHMESRPYRNLWRSKLQSWCVWLSMVKSRQLVASPTELTGLVPRVGVIHFDVGADSGAQKLRVFIFLLYSVFFGRVCNAYDNYSRMLVYCIIWLLVWYVHLSVCPYAAL